ncbi:MAG: DUF2336 domain-containing protein [Rhodospirillaceae bacterium]|jgi:uncharacterized protein (DUF2336 family)|nr:DUF2336 domain-containing protein [Rhodospirillaceae bacterium]
MTSKIEHLENLARLAKETSPEKRQALLRDVSDLFLDSHNDLSETESQYFGDIMGKVAFDLEMKVRQSLSEKLANVDGAPNSLVKLLANDEIEVARPVLMNSTVLSDDDLISVIDKHGQDHIMAVTKREHVSELVSDSIVEKGNDEVLASLAGNKGAELSTNALMAMVGRSKGNEILHEPLVLRGDLPPEMMQEMMTRISEELKEKILAETSDLSSEYVDELLAETQSEIGIDYDDEEVTKAEKFISRKESLNQLNSSLLLQLLRSEKITELIAGFSAMAKVDFPTTRKIILVDGGESLVVLCKAVGMSQAVFVSIMNGTDKHGVREEADMDALLGVYGRITQQAAQRALRFFRTRKKVMENSDAE